MEPSWLYLARDAESTFEMGVKKFSSLDSLLNLLLSRGDGCHVYGLMRAVELLVLEEVGLLVSPGVGST